MEDEKRTVEETTEEQTMPEESQQPYKSYATKKEHDEHMEAALKERLERKDRKLAEEKAETERKAREQALKDQEDWKKLAGEHTETIEAKNKRIEELSGLEGERDTANERVETLEKRLGGLIRPQLEVVPELYRPFLADMPVEKQAEWLEENAEKLTANGSIKPAGSRPTGRPAPPQRQEPDKDAREAQRIARVSSI